MVSKPLWAQDLPVRIFLMRHAEKAVDDTKDPALSEKGKQMASRLDSLLRETKIDAVFSTPYKRTKMTASAVAMRNAVPILDYDPSKVKLLLDQIDKKHLENVVVIGHGNTVPDFVNTLFPNAKMSLMEESDYGRLFVTHYYKNEPQRNNYFVLNIDQ
ncbi:MAG TPA: histidine phosphatase family protein [Dyadobacter sp.]|nr:histidine phosphatase family protein [Dyadobacter sp.]